jgi:hypothetical protein
MPRTISEAFSLKDNTKIRNEYHAISKRFYKNGEELTKTEEA